MAMMSVRKQEPGQVELIPIPASLGAWAHHTHFLDEEAKARRVPGLALDKQNEGRAGLCSRWPPFEAGNYTHMLKTSGLRSRVSWSPVSGHRQRSSGHSWGAGRERTPPATWGRRQVWRSFATWPKVVFCFFQVCKFDLKRSVLRREGQAGADRGMPPGKASGVWRAVWSWGSGGWRRLALLSGLSSLSVALAAVSPYLSTDPAD